MKIIYCHHALREKNNPPTQQDGLQPLGIEDAKITSELVKLANKNNNIKAIYSSEFYRCMETARIINKHLGVPIICEPRFNEYGSVANESWVDLQNRIQSALLDISEKYDDDDDCVICVTSGVNVVGFINLAYGINPSKQAPFIGIPSCSPMIFEIKSKKERL